METFCFLRLKTSVEMLLITTVAEIISTIVSSAKLKQADNFIFILFVLQY